jgi:hypothetical protein
MIDVCAWATDRATAAAFLQAINVATLDVAGNLIPTAEVIIHPFRPEEQIAVVTTPAVLDADGHITTPAVIAEGWHFNLRFYGSSEMTLTTGLAQTDGAGKQLGLFDRTHILDLVDARTGQQPVWATTHAPVAPGYECTVASTGGIARAFDPATLNNRRNVWQ